MQKFLLIIIANFSLLTLLLYLWTDKTQLILKSFSRGMELIQLILLSGCLLLGAAVYSKYSRQKPFVKLKMFVFAVLLFSSCFYATYLVKAVENQIINSSIRTQVSLKLQKDHFGRTQAEALSWAGYQEITKTVSWLPKLNKEASHISFRYKHYEFLGDFERVISYQLPIYVQIDSVSIQTERGYQKHQSVKITESGVKYITCTELQM